MQAAFLGKIRDLLATEELPALGPESRASARSMNDLDEEVREMASEFKLTPSVKELVRAAAYLWHDHLDPAHHIAQNIETSDGSLLHGIMHRREPDFSNAKYWFRRVGSHPSYLNLAREAGDFLEKKEESDLRSRLVPNNTWDPFAFVDACEDVYQGQFASKAAVLQEIQRLEFHAFFEALANRLA